MLASVSTLFGDMITAIVFLFTSFLLTIFISFILNFVISLFGTMSTQATLVLEEGDDPQFSLFSDDDDDDDDDDEIEVLDFIDLTNEKVSATQQSKQAWNSIFKMTNNASSFEKASGKKQQGNVNVSSCMRNGHFVGSHVRKPPSKSSSKKTTAKKKKQDSKKQWVRKATTNFEAISDPEDRSKAWNCHLKDILKLTRGSFGQK